MSRYVPLVKTQLEKFIRELHNDVPSSDVCPRLHVRLEEIRNMWYGKSELECGWLVTSTAADGKPVEWEAREVHDCISDLQDLAQGVCDELDERFQSCYSDVSRLLYKCLDFGLLLLALCGTRNDGKDPVDRKKFSDFGAAEFRRCMEFVSQLPHVQKQNMEMGSEFSSVVYWRLKKVLIDIVWGTKFFSHFPQFFKAVVATDTATNTVTAAPSRAARKSKIVPLVLENGAMIEKFLKSLPQEFHLTEMFTIKLNNGREIDVIFQEDDMIRALYLDSSFYSEVGPEFCLIFDIMYANRYSLHQFNNMILL